MRYLLAVKDTKEPPKRTALGCAAASLSTREEGCRSTFVIMFDHWHHLLLSKIAKEGKTLTEVLHTDV
jgi:hypothetical protein